VSAIVFSFTSLTASLAQGNGPSISSILILVLGLLVAVVALAIIAPRLHIPYTILLVLGGLLLGFVPGLPRFTLDPDVVFLLLLPPLLYSSAWQTSWRDFHANLRPISLLALGLVLLTTIVVAVVAHVLIPDLPWAVAFVLGAIVSPTDAVAASAIAQRLGIPHRIVTIIEGESLVNDATGLVAYRFAVAAVVAGVFSPFEASLQFVVVSVGDPGHGNDRSLFDVACPHLLFFWDTAPGGSRVGDAHLSVEWPRVHSDWSATAWYPCHLEHHHCTTFAHPPGLGRRPGQPHRHPRPSRLGVYSSPPATPAQPPIART